MNFATDQSYFNKIKTTLVAVVVMMGLVMLPSQNFGQTTTEFEARLSGHSEVPSVATQGHGMISATLDGDSLYVSGSFADLESDYDVSAGASSELYIGAAGMQGNSAFTLTADVNADMRSGTFAESENRFELTSEQKAALQARELYVNIKTEGHAEGEIRGQLLDAGADAHYEAVLSAGSETHKSESRAEGRVVAELHGDSLIVSGGFADLEGEYNATLYENAKIHFGNAGKNGDATIELTAQTEADAKAGVFASSENRFELTADEKSALQDQALYVNITSSADSDGEIRGQIIPRADAYFQAKLSGSAQAPSVKTDASGQVVAVLRGDSLIVSGTYANLSSELNTDAGGGAHLHLGSAGTNGGVDIALNAESSADMKAGTFMAAENRFELTADQKASLFTREYYVNVHSNNYASGEIRGQLLPKSQMYFHGSLSSRNKIDPDTSAGVGDVVAELRGNTITVTGSFYDVEGEFNVESSGEARLEAGSTAEDGEIVTTLNAMARSETEVHAGVIVEESNTFTISSDTVEMLIDGDLFVSVATSAYTEGELRAQLLLQPNHAPDSSDMTAPADSALITFEGEASSEFSTSWEVASDPDGHEVQYIFQMSTDADFSADALIINENVGTSLTFTTDYSAMVSMLDSIGVESGSSTMLYTRVVTSDGSERTEGESSAMEAERGTVTDINNEDKLPESYTLQDNYPNPFNPTTTIAYTLPEQSHVTLTIYNAVGQEIATLVNSEQSAGQHRVEWRATDQLDEQLSSGVYFYQIQAGTFNKTKKMVLMK
ncbi:MAG: CHRD domain-containing protein [Candidatus Marinimicrobia bacterium]|nr:CHRD domain-containing protein [Candidatus Neomarinimicrobiota bacterium]MCF7829638.1 CHRD domain-containing protein [Candidatus Neomarinimicrobiota bacterium]MCF7879798.1 CHRD domain-containing protein [Candidatus Neomarinimicrobiota bacterium]